MKMADGGFRPAYNVQFATDTKSTVIAGVSVDNIGSDMGKMLPMNDALAGQYGARPRQHLADGASGITDWTSRRAAFANCAFTEPEGNLAASTVNWHSSSRKFMSMTQ
jgi:hypothetical protein